MWAAYYDYQYRKKTPVHKCDARGVPHEIVETSTVVGVLYCDPPIYKYRHGRGCKNCLHEE